MPGDVQRWPGSASVLVASHYVSQKQCILVNPTLWINIINVAITRPKMHLKKNRRKMSAILSLICNVKWITCSKEYDVWNIIRYVFNTKTILLTIEVPVPCQNFVITMPADSLAPHCARPSAGTMVTAKLETLPPTFRTTSNHHSVTRWRHSKWPMKYREILRRCEC